MRSYRIRRPDRSPSTIVRTLLAGVPLVAVLASASVVAAQAPGQPSDTTVAKGTIMLVGTVRDAAGRPIAGAELRVGQRHVALSDTAGRFLLPGMPAEPMELVVRRIGYERTSLHVVPTQPGVRIELAVQLASAPFRLPSVLVEGKAYDKALWDAGFYKRERVGYGKYFDPDFMQHYGGASLATLVREVPRVHLEQYGDQWYAYGRIAGNQCRMNIYVDGMYRREAMSGDIRGMNKGVGLNLLVPKEEVYAVEVYPTINSLPVEFTRVGPKAGFNRRPSARIPVGRNIYESTRRADEELTNNDAACGAIVIWTKWGLAARVAKDSARAP